MTELFLEIINRSISASWMILVVLIFRLVLKKAPKWVNVLLWCMVAVRLICPFTIESSFSMLPQFAGNDKLVSDWMNDYVGEVSIIHDNSIYYDAAVAAGREPIPSKEGGYYVVTAYDQLEEPKTVENTIMPILTIVWGLGICLLILYTMISYWHLRQKTDMAILYQDNIFQSEKISFPFVFGIIRPRIYLPFKTEEQDLKYVIAHEKAHILRKDHWWKSLGFLLLIIHWFNPLIWLSYVLLCRDIELACDEKVIKKLDNGQRADYTQALLSCSVERRMIAASPLAFGEVGVKERVKSVMNYKKPAFWVSMVSLIVCVIAAICFLTNPRQDSFDIKIVVPAGSQEKFVYSEEEISPTKHQIILSSGDNLGDTEVVLKPIEVTKENLYEPTYLTPGIPVKMDVEKGAWFKIGINMQNPRDEDLVVYIRVKNIGVRIADSQEKDLEQYRTEYIGDASNTSAIAQRLPYPGEYSYSSIELQTRTEPYELIIYLNGNGKVQEKNFKQCADIAFDLIENMGIISFYSTDSETVLFSFTREDYQANTAVSNTDESASVESSSSLDDAISKAVLEHTAKDGVNDLIHVESHDIVHTEEKDNIVTVYLQAYESSYYANNGNLQQESGSNVPTVITFSVNKSGEYRLKEYWIPQDGSDYISDIQNKFPKEALNALNDAHEEIQKLSQECYNKAMIQLESTDGLEVKIVE